MNYDGFDHYHDLDDESEEKNPQSGDGQQGPWLRHFTRRTRRDVPKADGWTKVSSSFALLQGDPKRL